MKATIYYGPKDIRLEEVPKPEAGPNDVVVKVVRAGICGSDLTAYQHDGHSVGILKKGEFGVDGQFGHEMAGIVDSVGENITDIRGGDRVFVNPTVCKRNGMLGCDMAGAFSEYMLVEEARYGYNLLRLADNTTFDEAVMIEPLSVGTHGKNCIDVRPHEKVVIYGAGTIGLCALSAVLSVGCKAPVVIDLDDNRLDYVTKLGGAPFNPAKGTSPIEFLYSHFGKITSQFGMPCVDVDAYIDCAGAKPILNEIVKNAKSEARISIVAVHKHPAELEMSAFGGGELTMKGSCGYKNPDVIEAFQNIMQHRTKISGIITHHFPQSKVVEAFETAADQKTGAIKVVIDYD